MAIRILGGLLAALFVAGVIGAFTVDNGSSSSDLGSGPGGPAVTTTTAKPSTTAPSTSSSPTVTAAQAPSTTVAAGPTTTVTPATTTSTTVAGGSGLTQSGAGSASGGSGLPNTGGSPGAWPGLAVALLGLAGLGLARRAARAR